MSKYQERSSKSLVRKKSLDHCCYYYICFLNITGNAKGLETGIRGVINGRTQNYVSVIHGCHLYDRKTNKSK